MVSLLLRIILYVSACPAHALTTGGSYQKSPGVIVSAERLPVACYGCPYLQNYDVIWRDARIPRSCASCCGAAPARSCRSVAGTRLWSTSSSRPGIWCTNAPNSSRGERLDEQFLTSAAIGRSSDVNLLPPSPLGPLVRIDRMKVLVSSSGSVCHVGAERVPDAVLQQILLDVREIEGRDRRVSVLQISPDRADGLGPREVADDWAR